MFIAIVGCEAKPEPIMAKPVTINAPAFDHFFPCDESSAEAFVTLSLAVPGESEYQDVCILPFSYDATRLNWGATTVGFADGDLGTGYSFSVRITETQKDLIRVEGTYSCSAGTFPMDVSVHPSLGSGVDAARKQELSLKWRFESR